jgi:hypothetical protein
MSRPIKVVVVRSLSFTGTTWLNLVLGSHARAFTIGPPDRVMRLASEEAHDACRVHAGMCEFWPAFFRALDPEDNFLVQLADFADRDVLIINNPMPDGAEQALSHPRLVVKPIHLIRDGRAIAASHHRKYPDGSFFDSVRDWLAPSFSTFPFDDADPDVLSLRYEDLLADQRGHLPKLSGFIGLDYDEASLRFWEHDHHITAGNAGTIMMIKLHQGIATPDNDIRAFYEGQLRRLEADPTTSFADERWRDELSRRDLFVFDHFCGGHAERFGYERDTFTVSEVDAFRRELRLAEDNGASDQLSTGPVALSAASPAPETPGLRTQLRPAWMRRHGLHLDTRQVRRLALTLAAAIAALVIVVILLTVLLVA